MNRERAKFWTLAMTLSMTAMTGCTEPEAPEFRVKNETSTNVIVTGDHAQPELIRPGVEVSLSTPDDCLQNVVAKTESGDTVAEEDEICPRTLWTLRDDGASTIED